MKNLYYLSIAFITCLFLSSCQNNEIDDIDPVTKSVNTKSLSFTYDNITYTSEYSTNADGSYKFSNDAAQDAYEKILTITEPAILVLNDNYFVIFNNNTELDSYIETSIYNRKTKATIGTQYELSLYEHDGYTGRSAHYVNTFSGYAVADLGNFDNTASSFRCTITVPGSFGGMVRFYRSKNFKDSSLAIVCRPYMDSPRLRNYSLGGFLGIGASNWNDIISSFRIEA